MEITTFLFALFVILTGLGYQVLPKRIKNLWMLLASSVFIVTWSWKFLVSLLLLATINYLLGFLVPNTRFGKKILWAGIVINILALLVFKYSDFYLPALMSLLARLGVPTGAGGLQILAPLGISFITVQMISYLVDVHYGRLPAEKEPVRFALYVIYFPKILSGPVERAKTFLSRLESPQKWSGELLRNSFALVLVGLVRKLVLADVLNAMIPADAFQQPSKYPAPLLAAWLLVYAFALYNDFAGYTSIVRGVSGFFGIELTNNFNIPYFARSFSEFWNRWHISLSNWLRDYIFFPLSRSLLKKIPERNHPVHIIVPPMLTMLVCGLWHGFTWNTLLWGGLQGGFLVLERIGTLWKPRVSPADLPRWRQVIAALGVFLCILMAWVPFHTGVVPAIQYWKSLLTINNWHFSIHKAYFLTATQRQIFPQSTLSWVSLFPFFQAGFVLLGALLLDVVLYKDELRFLKWPAWLQAVLLIMLVAIFFLLSFAEKGAPFIYQAF